MLFDMSFAQIRVAFGRWEQLIQPVFIRVYPGFDLKTGQNRTKRRGVPKLPLENQQLTTRRPECRPVLGTHICLFCSARVNVAYSILDSGDPGPIGIRCSLPLADAPLPGTWQELVGATMT